MKSIWHPYHEWECFHAGMFNTTHDMPEDEAKRAYAEFLRDIPRFVRAMKRVIEEWPMSCEHFLTKHGMNRVAWLGQASMCIDTGIPRAFRGGFMLMTPDECNAANRAAQNVLDEWLKNAEKDSAVHRNVETKGIPRGHSRQCSLWPYDGESCSLLPGHRNSHPQERPVVKVARPHTPQIEVVQ